MGDLRDLVIARKTAERYWDRVEEFIRERKAEGGRPLRSVAELDLALERKIRSMWWNGDPKGWCYNARSNT